MQLHYPLNPATGLEDPTQLPWTNGVPLTGQEGSYPPSAMCVEVMQELVNLIVAAGLTPASSDLSQVIRSIRSGQLDWDATDTGTADAIQLQIGLSHAKVIAGLPFAFIKGASANTGITPLVMTITDLQGNNPVSGQILKANGTNLGKGDLPAGGLIVVRADTNGNFRLVSLTTLSDVLATGSVIRVTDTAGTSTPDLLVGTTAAPITGYALNHAYVFTQGASPNATSTPKGNVANVLGQAFGALTFVKRDGSPLAPGDLSAGMQFLATLDPAGGKLRLSGLVASDAVVPATGNVNLWVAPATATPAGNDSTGNGSLAAPFASIAKAVSYGASRYLFVGFALVVNLLPGTYAPPGPIIGVPNVTVQGDTSGSNAGAYSIAGVGNAGSFLVGPSSNVRMNLVGVQVTNTGTVAGNVAAIQGGALVLTNIILNATVASTSGVLIGATGSGTVTVAAGCQIGNVNFGAAFSMGTGGGITLTSNLAIGGSPNFAQAFAVATTGGSWTTVNGAGFTGSASSVTGTRYLQSLFGTFNTAGSGVNYFPGNAAGTAAQTGSYV